MKDLRLKKSEPDQLDRDCSILFDAMKGWTYQRQIDALEQTADYIKHMRAMDEVCTDVIDVVDEWFGCPLKALGLNNDQIVFLERHKIYLSTAYIGMVRASQELPNGKWKLLWQTSPLSPIADAIAHRDPLSDEVRQQLCLQTQLWVDKMMQASLPITGIDADGRPFHC